jgi:dTMP kinase
MTGAPSTRNLISSGPFSRLFWAGFISSTGDWAALFAQISLADFIAGSQGIVVVLAARVIPGLVGGAIGGVLADRINRKLLIFVADVGRGFLVLTLAFADNLVELFTVSVVLEMLTLLGQPARAAVIPGLVGRENLLAANSLTLTAAYGTFPLGAGLALALGLIPTFSLFGIFPSTTESVLFSLDSLTFILSGLLVLTIAMPPQEVGAERQRRSRFDWRAPLRDFWDGIKFVASTGAVRGVILGMSLALFGGGMLIVLGKAFAEDTLNADATGFFALLFALGTGAAIGMTALTVYGDRLWRRDASFGASLLITGVGMGAASLVQTVAGGMGWLFVMGFGAGASYVLGFTHLHEQTDDEVRGRTFAALFSLMRVGLLVAMLVATYLEGLLTGRFGSPFDDPSRMILLGGAFVVMVAGGGMLWSVRAVFLHPKPSAEAIQSLEAAGRAFRTFRRDGDEPE